MRRHTRGKSGALRGAVRIPGDKSVSHRALMLAALAGGRSEIARPNLGHDVLATAALVTALGAACDIDAPKSIAKVEGRGGRGLREPADVLDAGNSGTTMRLGLGLCAGIEGSSIVTGDASLRRRPMLRVVGPLRQMGALVDGRDHGDLAPLHVRGARLEGLDFELPVASAQVKSAILLAGLGASGVTRVAEPAPSRDHTERILAAAGVEIDRSGTTVSLKGDQIVQPFRGVVPGDVSSAMFLIAAGAIVPGSSIELKEVGLNPTRTAALQVLRDMGAAIETEETSRSMGEPIGTIRVSQADLRGVSVPPSSVPGLIDEIPALAVIASQAEGETVFSGAAELRVKESDRIAAIVTGLNAIGADAEELPDGLVVRGPTPLHGGEVDSVGDHRIALSLAVAGLVAEGSVRVRGWSCVATSFPEFLDVLGEVSGKR